MVWELARKEYLELKSYKNKKRIGRLINMLKRYTDGSPTPATYIEFISYFSRSSMTTPFMVARAARYMSENRTLSRAFGLPFFAGAYLVFDNHIDRNLAWKALKQVENQSVQAFFAIMISGMKYHEVAIRLRLEEYDRVTGVACNEVKITPQARAYVDAQYDRAIKRGLGPSDPLFFTESKDGVVRRIGKRDIRRYNKRVLVNTGIDLYEYCLLSYRMRQYEPRRPIKIVRGGR